MNPKTLFLLALCLPVATSWAVTARRTPIVYQQPDGSSITVFKCGDEHVHWLTTTDGRLLAEQADGSLRYATEADSMRLVQSCQRATRRRAKLAEPRHAYPAQGNPRSLVILAEYPDCRFLSPTANDDFWRMLNEAHYADNGGTGSARDYYTDASLGQFTPQFDVVGPIMLTRAYNYYGENDSSGEDLHAEDMIIEACQLADAEIDFSDYDYDQDGIIDNVFVFYAGYGEATCSDENTVWPQSWDIMEYTSNPILFDGVRLNHYACTNERDTDDLMDGIGTFVHEFGHVLGLPDLYSTNYTMAWTPGQWSVMDAGNYLNNSRTPVSFSAYERACIGWLKPSTICEPAHVVLPELQLSNSAARISTLHDDEYYILENRQQAGWDRFLPGHGMLIWHIDYDAYIWQMNRVNNNGSHQYVDIIEADDIRSNGTMTGDPFPGSSNVSDFTATTKPAFVSWQGQEMRPLTHITETKGIITFDYDGGGDNLIIAQLTPPEAFPAQQVTTDGFLAEWTEVADAEAYLLTVCIDTLQADSATTDFTDFGSKGLPSGWETNSISTYANAGYSGQAIPSLRLNANGHQLTSPVMHSIQHISFWHRGTSTLTTQDEIVLQGFSTEQDQWIELTRLPITTQAGGATISYEPLQSVSSVRIVFSRQSDNGSLAIDDVAIDGFQLVRNPVSPDFADILIEAPTLQYRISGLHPSAQYFYAVKAVSGRLESAMSNVIEVNTMADAAIEPIHADTDSAPCYNIWGNPATASDRWLIQQGKVLQRSIR